MLEGMNSRTTAALPHRPAHTVGRNRFGARGPLPRRVYLWRRLLVLAVAVCVLWGSFWGVLRLGGLLGAHLIAPALGTAPVPVADGAQADT